jgi:hypothetical protein
LFGYFRFFRIFVAIRPIASFLVHVAHEFLS